MSTPAHFNAEILQIIKNALREDIGDGDHSSLACIPPEKRGKAKLLVKEEGIIAGVAFAKQLFKYVDPDSVLTVKIHDGAPVQPGDVVFHVEGNAQTLLKTERLALNTMQRMSAVATKTHTFVKLLEGTRTTLLDTRKTTPGIRVLEKWAVSIGGGTNHRMGLYDTVMLKDNHTDLAGGISGAINKTKTFTNK